MTDDSRPTPTRAGAGQPRDRSGRTGLASGPTGLGSCRTASASGPAGTASGRGQSNVIGVALLLGVTVLALGMLTAAIGAIVGSNAAAANADRVATDMDQALQPVEATGQHSGRISFSEGSLTVVERELRVLDEDGVVETVQVDALVYESGDHRVVYLAGAVVHETGDGARLRSEPPITASSGSGGVLVVGAPVLGADRVTFGTTEATTLTLHTDVTHDRTELGDGEYRVAIETETPGPWREHFQRQGADVTTHSFDDDEVDSVVASYPGERTAYLVVHRMNLTITHDGEPISGGDDDA